MVKRILYILLWVAIIAGVIALILFINKKQKETICSNVLINIDTKNELNFVSQQDVWQMIYRMGDSIKGQKMGDIDAEKIRTTISKNQFVKSVEVYTTFMGEVNIEVVQRRPIVRVITFKNQNVFVDEDGLLMPTHPSFSPRVVVARGFLNIDTIPTKIIAVRDTLKQKIYFRKSNLSKVIEVAKCLDTSAFWKAQISEINVSVKNEIELIPQIGNHIIILGDIDNMVEKFGKLYLFYNKELNNFGFNKYKKINLKYKNQIVCSKK